MVRDASRIAGGAKMSRAELRHFLGLATGRVMVSLPLQLVRAFDEFVKRSGYRDRSAAIAELMVEAMERELDQQESGA
jgi:hypothetical protein